MGVRLYHTTKATVVDCIMANGFRDAATVNKRFTRTFRYPPGVFFGTVPRLTMSYSTASDYLTLTPSSKRSLQSTSACRCCPMFLRGTTIHGRVLSIGERQPCGTNSQERASASTTSSDCVSRNLRFPPIKNAGSKRPVTGANTAPSITPA